MPIHRRPVDTASILLNQVTEVIATQQSNPPEANNPLLLSFQKIKTQLEDMKDHFFPQLDHCDKAFKNALAALEKLIDDDDMFVHRDQNEKIKSIEENLEYIDKLKSQIHLPEPAELPAESQPEDPSVAEARKASEDWLRLSVEENILSSPAMASLQMSYDALELRLKLCLLCLAVFPEKVVVKKKPLIYWWIGEGLIRKHKDKSAEEEGEVIFNKLIGKGMIQPFHKGEDKKSPIVDSCIIHPWIRRMLIAVARKAEFLDIDHSGKIVNNYAKSWRACLVLGNEEFLVTNSSNEDELFSVFNVNEQYLSFKPELFLKLRKLVVIQLGRWQNWAEHHIEVENCEFLNEIHAEKHLRYLSLQGISGITSIPSSIVECNNLEILDLRACHNLETLPSDIGRLRKLTHLDVSQCFLLESMPKGIEKLSSLQVLKGFVIGHSRKNPCKLGDLAQLKKLRKLSIHIGSEAVIQEGELNKLKEIGSLRILTIAWGGVALQSKYGVQMGAKTSSNAGEPSLQGKKDDDTKKLTKTATLTMKSFSFPPKLEKLDLRCFPRRMSPDWLIPSNMEHLKRLYIRGGELDRLVSEGNKKWGVKILRLKFLKNLKLDESFLREDFPDLVYFEKIRCHQYQDVELEQYDPDVEWNNADGWEALRHKLSPDGCPSDMTEVVVEP